MVKAGDRDQAPDTRVRVDHGYRSRPRLGLVGQPGEELTPSLPKNETSDTSTSACTEADSNTPAQLNVRSCRSHRPEGSARSRRPSGPPGSGEARRNKRTAHPPGTAEEQRQERADSPATALGQHCRRWARGVGSSGADRLSTAPATAGDALILASSARSRTARCDSVSSPVRSTSPMTETIRGPTISSRR